MRTIKYIVLLLSLITFTWAAEATIITSSSQLLSGEDSQGVVGDYLLKNDSISFVISDIPNTLSPGKSGGLCIDAVLNGGQDDFQLMYLYLNKDWPRQAIYSSINIISAGAPHDSAHIRVNGVDSDNSDISIITDYVLYDDTPMLKVISTYTNNSSNNLSSYGIGDAFSWGSNPFVPGLGSTREGSSVTTWLASTTENTLYGYLAENEFHAIHGSYWSDATLEEVDIAASQTHTSIRYFMASNTLEDIYLANAILNELSTGLATISVTQNGLPVSNALISFTKNIHEAPSLESRTNSSGLCTIELETGSWIVDCSYGDQTAEESFVISTSTPQNVSLNLGDVVLPVFPKDTLTVIQSPLVNIPLLALPGETIDILLDLPSAINVSGVMINYYDLEYTLTFSEGAPENGLRKIEAILPSKMVYGLYDLNIRCDDTLKNDLSRNSINIIPEYKNEFTVVHVTDTHLPSKYYWGDDGLEADSSEIEDFRAVINDINIINPDFVIHTGDFINDGEIEALGVPSLSRGKKLLYELDVPLFLVAGNHDLGGWIDTPAPHGTARRTWWKFFGWDYLNSTSETATTTQNYSFNYGNVHFIGLESYDNYDQWRKELYGSTSFISSQFTWLNSDIAAHSADSLMVMFYHYDFKHEIDLNELEVDVAFWGHTHGNNEDSTHPYSISTAATCNGARNYRIIKFKNNQLSNSLAVRAGSSGSELTIIYNADSSQVRINNNHDIDLEQCMVTFPLESNEKLASLTHADLFQIDSISSPKIVYALVDVPANSIVDASITSDTIETSLGELLPNDPFLMNIYPNPFNPNLAISYQLTAFSNIEIKILNIQGKVIDTLFTGEQNPGSYELNWNASDQPSGLYFIKADIKNALGSFQSVEKCLLMK